MERVLGVCAVIAAVGGAAAVTGKAVSWVLRTVRKVSRLADDLLGEPERPGHPARPGLMDRVTRIEQRIGDLDEQVQRVKAQVYPNGGGSLHDKVSRVAEAVAPDQ